MESVQGFLREDPTLFSCQEGTRIGWLQVPEGPTCEEAWLWI